MSFTDNRELLRTPREFAEGVVGGEIGDDLGSEISNLLGFTKNFFLQFFSQYGVEISRLDVDGEARARAVERRLRSTTDWSALLLVSHYITISSTLDESGHTSDEMARHEAYEEVLYAVLELLDRIKNWAADEALDELREEARSVHELFEGAVASLLPI